MTGLHLDCPFNRELRSSVIVISLRNHRYLSPGFDLSGGFALDVLTLVQDRRDIVYICTNDAGMGHAIIASLSGGFQRPSLRFGLLEQVLLWACWFRVIVICK
jgi:hypothetical protein